MTDWSDNLTDLDELITGLDGFGESVILQDLSEILGDFRPTPDADGRWSNETAGGPGTPAPPLLWLLATDADGLDENDVLTIRDTDYAISRIDRGQGTAGLARLTLRPLRSQ